VAAVAAGAAVSPSQRRPATPGPPRIDHAGSVSPAPAARTNRTIDPDALDASEHVDEAFGKLEAA
jgi:hypothetical protein